MDHKRAIETQSAERYAFAELPVTERDAFEEHLVDCSLCKDEVKMALIFAANTKAVFGDRDRSPIDEAPAQPNWRAWFSIPRILAFSSGLNLALAGIALYAFVAVFPRLQNQIRTLESPTISESFVSQGVTRGSQSVHKVTRDSSLNFTLDLPEHFDYYSCVITSANGRTNRTYKLPGADEAETLHVTVPAAGLEPGDYKLRLSGMHGSESALLTAFTLRVAPPK